MVNTRRLKNFFIAYFNKLNYGAGGKRSESHVLPEDFVYHKIRKDRIWINILLFITTFITTTLAQPRLSESLSGSIFSGLQYSCTIMAILSAHEFGHYFAARRFGVDATLPYFIPFPSLIGTMGAVIKTRSPIPDRRALFYIGAMGPLPGFIVSLAAVITGIYLSQVQPVLPFEEGSVLSFGDSLLFSFIIHQVHGNIAQGSDLFLHPVAFAGWIGFLLTTLNLMPVGQLDGGHILYSLIGKRQRYAGWIFLAALVFLSFYWPGWIVWVIIILFLVMVGHPYIHDTGEDLTLAEKVTGWVCMIILLLTFIPVPVTII
ncbi:MAG TPA: site-2 protease family protein [Spirochaetota bacterium]|nr:site-2 protease family protein [Spirochaetota bacterium]